MKIRVLHIITRFIRGGADENTRYTAEALDPKYYWVNLLAGGESDFSYLDEIGKEVSVLVIPELKRNIDPVNDLIAFVKIFKLIKSRKYHLVHTHTAKGGFIGRMAAALAGTPIIVHTLHGVTFHDFMSPLRKHLYILLERLAALVTDLFITVGDDLKTRYISRNIGSSEKYVTIRSGIDLKEFWEARELPNDFIAVEKEKLGIPHSDVVVGTISRLEPRKGHIYLLRAASRIVSKFPNIKFVIIGDGYYKTFLEEEVKNLNLTEHIIFLGHRKDVPKLIALMDIVTLTSLWEGLPRALVQAAAVGKPIVTFDIEGAREVVEEGVNGFIVPPQNIDLLTEKLLFLATNLPIAQTMGLQGRKRVNNCWDVETMVQRTLEVYEELISRKLSSSRLLGRNEIHTGCR